MATIVLVHGGWTGGWRWRPAIGPLRAAGHEVFAPTLTGLGERVHLARPDIDLDTHVLDVFNLLVAEDLSTVVLVGHSYGGLVITGVADRCPERIGHLIYLDAFVPHDGESLLDLVAPEARQMIDDGRRDGDDAWRADRPNDARPRPRPTPSPRDSPQPWQTFAQGIGVSNPAAAKLPRLYVRATADKQPGGFMAHSFAISFARVRREGWPIREVALDHNEVRDKAAAILLDLLPPSA
ncbi:MAG TPA: alpha/beta hydrolase [Thermomicrobiales bacterium]